MSFLVAVAALNDALHALGMNLTFQPPVSSGMWTVTDDLGNKYQFKVGLLVKTIVDVDSCMLPCSGIGPWLWCIRCGRVTVQTSATAPAGACCLVDWGHIAALYQWGLATHAATVSALWQELSTQLVS